MLKKKFKRNGLKQMPKAYLLMMLAMGLVLSFTSCEKDDDVTPVDPEKEKYAEMQIDSTSMAQEIKYLTKVKLAERNNSVVRSFWILAVRGPPAPENFVDSVSGIKPNGDTLGGYVGASDYLVETYGPNGTNSMPTEDVELFTDISTESTNYLNILPLIAAQREKIK